MKQIINEPTRVTLDSSTLIEHIATTNCKNITESGVLKVPLNVQGFLQKSIEIIFLSQKQKKIFLYDISLFFYDFSKLRF